MRREEALPDQQQWGYGPDYAEPPQPAHIKEEWEELWTRENGQQLQRPQEADINMFTFNPVPVKREEEDGEKPQYAQSCQTQTEENRGVGHLKTEANGEDSGGSGASKGFNPDSYMQPITPDKTSQSFESETDDSSCAWEETWEPQSALVPQKNKDASMGEMKFNTGNTTVSSSECAPSFGQQKLPQEHKGVQTVEKPFSCTVCGRRYPALKNLKIHMLRHSEEKPHSCAFCKKSFHSRADMETHMRVHTGEKPFSCEVCGKRFSHQGNLRQHAKVHTGEKRFSCSICDKKFTWLMSVKRHMSVCKGSRNEMLYDTPQMLP
ncbi:zinc finger protein 135-like isoform X2 [Cheilinus undulatus]|nr:zinc finger protein 135-like isoform X2 [Cheilinus undulatus]